jgi:MFS family permease
VFALAPCSIADLLAVDNRGVLVALIGLAHMLGPAMGPVAGSYINATWSWKWAFNVSAIAGAVLTTLGLCCLWGTNEAVLLERKARRLRRETHNITLRSRLGKGSEVKGLGQALVMPVQLLLCPPVFLNSLVAAIRHA